MATRLIRNLKGAAATTLGDIGDIIRGSLFGDHPELNQRESACLRQLQADGFCVIEGYWDREKVEALRTRLYEHVSESDVDFEGGAYLRHRTGSGYDEGIVRINHVDKLIHETKEFRFDPFPLRIAQAYYRKQYHSGMLIFQHNPESTGVTRTFHVDCFTKEFKSFLYLDDVDESNGPFTFIRGSHRNHALRLKKQILGNRDDSPTTFFEEDVKSILDREVKIV